MAVTLTQKSFLKDTREFELADDTIIVRTRSLLKEKTQTIDLSSLDPDPVIKDSELAFFSPHKGRPIFSLLLNKPNKKEFDAFVEALKQKIAGEDNSFAGIEAVSPETAQSALARNIYEEPPEFGEPDDAEEKASFQPVNAERLGDDISMLQTYLDGESIETLIEPLEKLRKEPENEAAFQKALDAFNDLGIKQGAVLTYAPYFKVLVSKYIRL